MRASIHMQYGTACYLEHQMALLCRGLSSARLVQWTTAKQPMEGVSEHRIEDCKSERWNLNDWLSVDIVGASRKPVVRDSNDN